ncbi:MAG: hypothetical protein SPJ69_00385 [Campylobacter sp.]|uniref:hypothetical protein n=1 Tax=Campylobacter sp. TaxID=205 RepID=UPI00297977B8|nr:hypothetical protein [Campylobacter sp.]MDD7600267.1 hypothetical protein [Campylobacteraceae bacterium]MDY5886760.1 hypothetical protein [Campylobacter sp.]
MKIKLNEIYAQLEAWRSERKITAQSQKAGYLVNIMEELGELAAALRDYEESSVTKQDATKKQIAEHEIIDALCDIAIFTINAGADISSSVKRTEIEWEKSSLNADYILKQMVEKCAFFSYFDWGEASAFNIILVNCAYLCEYYGFNFEIAMLETIKEISSRTGSYDEKAKKWVKDSSDEARKKWYQANYDLARL